MEGASVYSLGCADGSLHVGVTRRILDECVGEHNAGLTIGYTQGRRPVVLRHAEHDARVDEAVVADRRTEGWSRVKKVASLSGDSRRCRNFR